MSKASLERSTARSSGGPKWVGIFPDEDAIVPLVGAILLEQNDEWAVQPARYMKFAARGRPSLPAWLHCRHCGGRLHPVATGLAEVVNNEDQLTKWLLFVIMVLTAVV